ncbi:MAG: flagellar hook protein FlgE [Nitrospinales bacterium]
MSLVSALFTGVSGLSGNAKALEVLGDNISNVNTVGFKSSRPVFGDILSSILANGSTTSQVGRGSQLSGVLQSFSQGSFEASENALDMSIDGSGFFIVNTGSGNFFTRNGQFRLNDNGLVQSITGEVLQGFQVAKGVVSNQLTNIDLAGVQSAPKATMEFTLGANLNAAASAGTTFTSPISIFNSVGQEVILSIQFTKQAGGANAWRYALLPNVGSVAAGSPSGTSGAVTFGNDGQLSDINGGGIQDLTIQLDFSSSNPPANAQTLTWNLATASGVTNGKLTGFASQSNNNSFVQNGFSTGTLVGLSVSSTGMIQGLFNNGQTDQLFQVAMADFLSPTGLTRQGNNLFAQSAESGQPIIGTATTGGFGSLVGSSLELSNVDLASEFVTLIQTQQAFQASARVINTTDDLLTEAVNLVR